MDTMHIVLKNKFPSFWSYSPDGEIVWFITRRGRKGYVGYCVKTSPITGYKVGERRDDICLNGMVRVPLYIPFISNEIPRCVVSDDGKIVVLVVKSHKDFPDVGFGIFVQAEHNNAGTICGYLFHEKPQNRKAVLFT